MSWRDSDDPRCPECGEEISATATYCMHCYADLPTEDSATAIDADVDDSDDVTGGLFESDPEPDRGEVYGSGSTTDQSTTTEIDSGASTSGDFPSKDTSPNGRGSSAFDSVPSPHSMDGIAGRITSMLWTDVPEPEGVSEDAFTAPLLFRFPVGFVSGLFVFVVFTIFWSVLTNDFSLGVGGVVSLGMFFAIMWWLIRKPLPSDILSDACYGVSLLLFAMPVAFLVNRLVRIAIGSGGFGLRSSLLTTVLVAFVSGIPAVFFLAIGYAGNRYARDKLDKKAQQTTESTVQ